MNIPALMEKIKKAQHYNNDGHFLYLNDNGKSILKEVIYEWAAEQTTDIDMTKRIAELEAKVYAYEAIIANSNFKAMLPPNAKIEFNPVSDTYEGVD